MRIEIHATVPTRFQDTKPTVESNELQTSPIELHRSPFLAILCSQRFQYGSLESSDAQIGFDNRIDDRRGDVDLFWRWRRTGRRLGHEVRVCVPTEFREWVESLRISDTHRSRGAQVRCIPSDGHAAAGR